ncbi:hypothetical protein EDD16DRAFT_1186191 [Pisolithus croceorrhizus]|nr:hypothetical protein EDD16DRAFT_1186191 [Pisolithus croceorrhizus]KAI6125500.1 hypothetical protein EV401DRAFT_1077014 [Pisolithus croceorrhizus]KAI6160949.1 hypothetical protein EDD17DRAFT_723259 [Pisolithus thermaeus]
MVNTALGRVLDEDAVIRALEDGHLRSVGLDVYPNEPHVSPRLLEFPRNVLLLHTGKSYARGREENGNACADLNLRDFLRTAGGRCT